METSLFEQYIATYFRPIVLAVTTLLNGTAETPTTYLHRRMLRLSESVTGKWETLLAKNTNVQADIVSMDSSLPLKKRDSLGRASGDIPKSGLELKLNETQLTELQVLRARPQSEAGDATDHRAHLRRHPPRHHGRLRTLRVHVPRGPFDGHGDGSATTRTWERPCASTSKYRLVPSLAPSGVVWANLAATPIDDIRRMTKQAKTDGNRILRLMMGREHVR